MCCVVVELFGVKQQCSSLPMPVLVWRLPNPRTATMRHADGKKGLAKAEKVGQHQQLLLPHSGGIGFFLHEQLLCHLIVVVHRCNSPNTLWMVGAGGDADVDDRFGNQAVRDGGGVDVGYGGGFWVGQAKVRPRGGDNDDALEF